MKRERFYILLALDPKISFSFFKMFKCEYCNRVFDNKKSRASHVKAHKKLKYSSRKRDEYEKKPKLCEECNNAIPYLSYTNNNNIKFCRCSCRATFFNKKRSQKANI